MEAQGGFLRGDADPTEGLGPLIVTDETLSNRYGGGLTAMTAVVTAAGDTTVLTPPAGKKLQIRWVSAINDPDASSSPLIRIGFDGAADDLYAAYAVAHWEMFEGAINQALVVNLDGGGAVALTVHYLAL